MSGPKKADVQLKLERALDLLREQLRRSADYADCLESLGESELQAVRSEAADIAQRAEQPLTDEAQRLVPWEAPPLSILRSRIVQRMDRAAALDTQAASLRDRARALEAESDRLMAQARGTCQRIEQKLGGTVAGLSGEEQQVIRARQDAAKAQRNRTAAIGLLQQAADAARQARNEYAGVQAVAGQLDSILSRVDLLVAESRSIREAQAEEERRAMAVRGECQSLIQTLARLDHARFAPGRFKELRRDAERFESACQAGRFERANRYAASFLEPLRQLVADVQSRQTEWTSLRAAAARDLEFAQQEVDRLDREALQRWSGDSDTVAAAFAQLDHARRDWEAEQFSQASQATNQALQQIRQLHATAQENQGRHAQRSVIAEAVMQALCDLGYDTPCFQYAQRTVAGTDDELSSLAIYASHPGENGDMELRIGLDGQVDLQVEDIPEGRESLCHEQILGLQRQLGNELDFTITHWGRATHVAEPSEQAVASRDPAPEKARKREKERQDGPSL